MSTAGKSDLETARALLAVIPHLGRLSATVARERGAISPERARVLFRLSTGPVRTGELAQQCVITAPAMTELVEVLFREGLVRREDDPSDRRAVLITLTAAGRREVERFHGVVAEALGEVIADLEPAARDRLRSGLSDLRRALERTSQREAAGVR